MEKSIKKSPYFSSLNREQLEYYNKKCTWYTYKPGEVIINSHEQSTDIHFIASGQARIITNTDTGREIIIKEITAGDFFGEIAAIDGGARSASLHALSCCTVFTLSQADFHQLCIDRPEFAWQVMEHLVAIVRNMNDRLLESAFLKAKQRLYRELIRLSKKRANHENQYIISPTPVQSEIADRISSQREIVSRDMKDLERLGILKREKGGLVILDPCSLQQLAQQEY